MDLLSIVLLNTQELNSLLLMKSACVSRHTNALVGDIWRMKPTIFRKHTYTTSIKGKCRFCATSNASAPFYTCSKCSSKLHLITATDAKKQWYLNDDDLGELTSYQRYHQYYRKYIRLFDIEEVKEKAIAKYTPSGLYKKINKKGETSKAHQDRMDKITKQKFDFDESSTKWELCVADFLKNGKGGMKMVKERLERFQAFDDLVKKMAQDIKYISDYELKEYRSDYVKNNISNIEAVLVTKNMEMKDREERRIKLQNELQAVGLELRADSRLCAEYIEGTLDDMEYIIEVMKEMDYLHKHTKYRYILNDLIEDWKDDLRESLGWLPQEEYQEYFDEELPSLSHRAKGMALRDLNKETVPEFLHKYM